ncbi:selenoprotein Pb-like [Ranitomeya imitator]|uniref:selenoprotein Pb-like n=1 Tax=Ranitomeya imitator TaxID=111125 RepID=UPI0037E81CC4
MKGSSLFIASLLGLLVVVSSAHNETSFCKPPPRWSIGDEEPMGRSVGQVTVLALLQASCGFCLTQAANMGPLRDKLEDRGLANISYIIVNDQSFLSKLMLPELKRRAPAGIPVYEQLPNQEDVWEILNGDKDDFLIYDRCGRLTFHIRLPLSYLHYPYVEAAIISTYYEDYCQNCSFYANITKVNETLGNNTTDVKTEQRSETGTPAPEKDKSHGNRPTDRRINDHRERKIEHNHQPRDGERHEAISNDGERHEAISNDGERHEAISNDGERHQLMKHGGKHH